jgi:predicted NBD/HSP70 family sugar kinase
MVMITAAGRSSHVPADVRLANLARIVDELRQAGVLSRSEVARRVGISLPTAHRLVSDLADLELVEEEEPEVDNSRLGRPPVVYRFRDDAGLLVGVDVGNESTRLALTTLSGRVITAQAVTSDRLGSDLSGALVAKVTDMVSGAGHAMAQLAGAGVGIASSVDPAGILRAPPIHGEWDGLPLGDELGRQLGCEVTVAQDDHLSPIAESSDAGTFPGASSLLVIEIGRGIGVGMTLDGVPIAGAHRRFGRIAGWPVTGPAGAQGPAGARGPAGTLGPAGALATLGECLVTSGLVRLYHERGGSREVRDGAALAAAARGGDQQALAIFTWAAESIADLVSRLQLLCDPQAVVIGGGLARAYDLLEPGLAGRLPPRLKVARSVLGEQAVVVGAVFVAGSHVDSWLRNRLARA